jgi:hypothetical protein
VLESRRGHVCLSVVIVVRCQVEVPASGCSLVQGSSNDCGVSLCVVAKHREGGHNPKSRQSDKEEKRNIFLQKDG